MNAVFGLFDPDHQRREAVLNGITATLENRTPLQTRRFNHASGAVLACTSPVVPLDHATGPREWSLVVGHVTGVRRPGAWALERSARDGATSANGQSGIYLACIVDGAGVVTLAGDTLGFFPLYYWSDDEALVFASEPQLIHGYSRVPRSISIPGLAGILLQGHMANGQTLWQGIRRPDPGTAIRWQHGKAARGVAANPLTPTDDCFGLDYAQARHRMSATLASSVADAVKDGPVALMLSGGLDSRLVAGCLARIAPGRTTAYIFGDWQDIEVRCATAVRRALRMPGARETLAYGRFADLARQCVEYEQLSNTLLDFAWPSGIGNATLVSPGLVSGLHGDAVIGGTTIPWAHDPTTGEYTFDRLLASITAWGFAPADTAELLAYDSAHRVVSDVVDEMRARFDAMPGKPFQKAWLWSLQNRVRFHTFPYAWRMTTQAWPLTPYGDRPMLELAAAMPLCHVRDRRMQLDTLKQEFPLLARQPLDRNSWDCSPVVPTMSSRLSSTAREISRRLRPAGPDRRLYYRQYDINNPGWRSIRRVAELYRVAADAVLKPEALNRHLPTPETSITAPSGIRDTAGRKTLCALLILLGSGASARR